MQKIPGSSIVYVLLLVLCSRVSAQTAEIELNPIRDNTLYMDSLGVLSNGSGFHFFAGKSSQPANSIRRAVISFDVAGNIPAGSTILTAELQLFMSRTNSGSAIVEIHRLLSPWGEGTSDAPGEEGGGATSSTSDATWIHSYFDSAFWTNPGGDFEESVSSSKQIDSNGFYTIPFTPQMAADVQDWLDNPDSNFGWLIKGDEMTGGSVKRFDSRENSLIANRPKLTIFYLVPTCCTGSRGDINGDGVDANIGDLTFMVDRIFRGGNAPDCPSEADLNNDGKFADILDLTILVDFVFRGGTAPGPC